MDDLNVEAVQIFGINCFYVARTLTNFDRMMMTDDQSDYSNAWMLEIFLDSFQGFSGDGDFMSKFIGHEIRDQIKFSFSRRRFHDEIGKELQTTRPREGDLIFFPFPSNAKCFQIKYVDQTPVFYQLGQLYLWSITCELFEYSNETFNTGVPEIDRLQQRSINIFDWAIRDTDGRPLMFTDDNYWTEDKYDLPTLVPTADNDVVQAKIDGWIDWNQQDPFDLNQDDKVI